MPKKHHRVPAIVFAGVPDQILAKRIGAPDAALIQHRLLTRALRHLKAGGVRAIVAAPAQASEFAILARREGALPVLQPRGAQGARIGSMMQRTRGPAIVLDSETPGLDGILVRHAGAALGLFDLVLGPNWNGGFYLIGVRSPAHVFRLFKGVRWGGAHVLEDILARAPRHWIVGLLPVLAEARDGASLLEAAADYVPPRRRSSSLGVMTMKRS